MSLNVLPRSPIPEEDFTPLAPSLTQTPSTYFGNKPILYNHVRGCHVLISRESLEEYETLAALAGGNVVANVPVSVTHPPTPPDRDLAPTNVPDTRVASSNVNNMMVLEQVDVFVTTE